MLALKRLFLRDTGKLEDGGCLISSNIQDAAKLLHGHTLE